MKTVLIALACSAALAPAAQAKAPPKLTDAQIQAAANAVIQRLGEPVDRDNSSCVRTGRTTADCALFVRRDGEPGGIWLVFANKYRVPPDECIVPISIRRRGNKILLSGGYATGAHMQGYCGVRS